MSFNQKKLVAEYDLWMIFGDDFTFTINFPFNLTGYGFIFQAALTEGGTPVIDLDASDMVIVVGDPESVQNSVTIDLAYTVTEDFDFGCLNYVYKWITPSLKRKTFLRGSIHGDI